MTNKEALLMAIRIIESPEHAWFTSEKGERKQVLEALKYYLENHTS